MLKLIVGVKGTGKTKMLIESANAALEKTDGCVVVIEKGTKLIHEIKYQARLLDTKEYEIIDAESLYGFIAVSGLKMIQKVDLDEDRNLFVVSVILIAGIGGLTVSFGKVTLTAVACALILGILTNIILSGKKEH